MTTVYEQSRGCMDEQALMEDRAMRPLDGCAYGGTIREHARSLDSAHQQLRDHEEQILALRVQSKAQREQLSQLSSDTHENYRMTVEMRAEIKGLSEGQERTRQAVTDMHKYLTEHIDGSVIKQEKQTLSGLARYESQVKLWTRISATVAALLITAAMIYNAVSGKPILPWMGQ
jgi:chromosome segregation ATPase